MTGAARTCRVHAGPAQISYLETGAGPPLALLHGIGSAAASFWNQLEELSARFRVVAWDAPAYGASTALGAEHPAASNYAAALDDWLDALGIARCHLLGHSLGSLIAARFAAEHPERVITLTRAGVARTSFRAPATPSTSRSRENSIGCWRISPPQRRPKSLGNALI